MLFLSRYYIVFYIVGLLRTKKISEVRNIIIPIMDYFRDKKIDEKQEISKEIYSTKGIVFLEFKEKMAIFSLLVLMELPFSYVLKFIMKTMLEDKNDNEKYYAPIISDILNYSNKNKLVLYNGYDDEYKEVVDIINNYYFMKNDIINNNKYIKGSKKIAFIVDSMFDINYSVEKLTFDMVRNIKKYSPEYDIKIYVENNYNYTPEEKILLHSFIGDTKLGSEYFYEEHLKQIEGMGIEICYSMPQKDKEYRVKDMICSIFDYNPEIILTTTLCSYSINELYNYYPTVYLSMVTYNNVNKFDVQLYPHIEEIQKYFKERGKTFEEEIYAFEYGADFTEEEEVIYEREKFGMEKDDIILITVGVRVKVEITKEFADMIVKKLEKNEKIKWYIVGEVDIPAIDNNYKELLEKQIFKLGFEKNLGAFYKLCNIYINPPRSGGGFSIAQSIVNGIPVVSYLSSAAGKHYAGEESCKKDENEYIEDIEKLISDREYYCKKIESQRNNLKKYEYKGVIEKLILFMNEAQERYLKRKGINM